MSLSTRESALLNLVVLEFLGSFVLVRHLYKILLKAILSKFYVPGTVNLDMIFMIYMILSFPVFC